MTSDSLKFLINEVESTSSELQEFLSTYIDEISQIFPDFSEDDYFFSTIFLLTVNNQTVGIFISQEKGEELHIDVDFVIAQFRDMGVGEQFFDLKMVDFRAAGYERLISVTNNEIHRRYLERLGFRKSEKHPDRYELEIV